MNELVEKNDREMFKTLQSSIYPGSKDSSVMMIIDYCKAKNIDPLLKLVHLVPMSVKNANGQYAFQDVVMPGIGLYRVNASRTGRYAGISDIEYGPMIKERVGSIEIEYPEWASVSVFKIVGDKSCEFNSGKIYWKEEYARKSSKDISPNAMWAKRTRGQLGKCAEAHALRKAFPEENGFLTIEEMSGKSFSNERKDCTDTTLSELESKLIGSSENIPEKKIELVDISDVCVGDLNSLENRRIKAFLTFKTAGISEDKILKYLNKPSVDNIDMDDLETLMSIYLKIKDGTLQVENAFPTLEDNRNSLDDLNDKLNGES